MILSTTSWNQSKNLRITVITADCMCCARTESWTGVAATVTWGGGLLANIRKLLFLHSAARDDDDFMLLMVYGLAGKGWKCQTPVTVALRSFFSKPETTGAVRVVLVFWVFIILRLLWENTQPEIHFYIHGLTQATSQINKSALTSRFFFPQLNWGLWLDDWCVDWPAAARRGLKRSHLMNFLGSVGGVGGGRGLLELSSRWWRGELGMGSRRLGWAGGGGGGGACGGCPLPEPATPTPTPAASIALTLEELLNLLAAVFSFFLFCYTENKKKRRGTRVKMEQKGSLKQNNNKKR